MRAMLWLLLCIPFTCLAQNAGIGISPTKGKLEISGSVGNTVAIFGADAAGISVQNNRPAIGFNQYYTDVSRMIAPGSAWTMFLEPNTGSLAIENFTYYSGATPNVTTGPGIRKMTIGQNGNVAIYTSAQPASLFVDNSTIDGLTGAIFRGTTYHSIIYEGTSVGKLYKNTYIRGGKAGSRVYLNDVLGGNVIAGNGTTKVGINTDPTDMLEVKQYNGRGLALISGSSAWELFSEKNLTENGSDMYVYYNGGNLGNFFHIDGKYYSYSDRRAKTNIRALPSVLNSVMMLNPVSYHMLDESPANTKSIGFIAQEVNQLFPEITDHLQCDEPGYNGMKDLYTLNYAALGPIAIKAIQEQQAILTQLRQQVEGLQKRIAEAEKLFSQKQSKTLQP